MFKKILITMLLLTALFSLGIFNAHNVFAQATGGTSGSSSTSSSDSTKVNSEDFKFDLGAITHADIKEKNWIRKGINFFFERAITIMAATVGGAAVLMMTIGGFMMIASAGRQEMYDKGKGMLLKAMYGLAFVLGAYILVTTVQLLIKSIFSS